MSQLILTQNSRLTDALERDLLRGAMERHHAVHASVVFKRAGKAIVNAVRGVASFIADVNANMNAARAASTHYTGSQW